MKRVAVVGCPGAGKTTLCRALSKKTRLPIIHLDTYYHDKSQLYYKARDLSAWHAKVDELVSEDKWIIDGNFGSTFKQRFARADTIIFLDYPRYLCVWRLIKRRIKFHRRRREEMPEGWQEKINYVFWRYVWRFRRVSRPEIMDALPNDRTEIVIFKRPSDAAEYLEMLSLDHHE